MKLALGTVQWGLDYGISNTNGIPSDAELDAIVRLAIQNGVDLFDTASKYGNAEQRLGNYITKNSSVVSKFSSVNHSSLENEIQGSLERLNVEQLYGYLFHSPKDLINTPLLWDQMQNLKVKEKVKKIGYSLYSPEELELFLDKNWIPDIVQLPYSLLDRKFEPYFEQLKSLGTEIHIRSVFLQGLYFISTETLSSTFNDLKSALTELEEIAREFGLTKVELAMSFVLKNRYVDYAVIGVEQLNQLKEIISASKIDFSESIAARVKTLSIENHTLLNPSNWI
jgi:aryl-alcohol dehydrogenase-like predicted oxidoreductase